MYVLVVIAYCTISIMQKYPIVQLQVLLLLHRLARQHWGPILPFSSLFMFLCLHNGQDLVKTSQCLFADLCT